ncbi:MAG: tetratricopeptide repeat protein [Promethearchaeota archaeon]
MPDSIEDEILRGYSLLNDGKVEELLQIIDKIEMKKNLAPQSLLSCQLLKANTFFSILRFGKSLQIANKVYLGSIELAKPLCAVDAFSIKHWCQHYLGSYSTEQILSEVETLQVLLNSVTNVPVSELELRRTILNFWKGINFYYKGALGLASEQIKLDPSYFKKDIKWSKLFPIYLMAQGYVYYRKGDLSLALQNYKIGVESIDGKSKIFKLIASESYRGMGNIYYLKGDLIQALKFFEKSIEISIESAWFGNLGWVYLNIIKLLLDKDNIKQAQEYLDYFKLFKENADNTQVNSLYELSKARILRSSGKIRDLVKTEENLKEILDNEEYTHIITQTLVELCDIFLEELRITNDLMILKDVEPYIAQLIEKSERSNSYWLLAETTLLKAKLEMLQINMANARKYLTQAQQIAERFSLNQLVSRITNEKDDLLKKLDLWKKLKEMDAPMSDRFELARLDEQIKRMVKKQVELTHHVTVEKVAISKEKKICLVCRGEVLRYSYICECGAIYCDNCAQALTNLENVCWACDISIDYLKPMKRFKEKEEKVEVKEEVNKKF